MVLRVSAIFCFDVLSTTRGVFQRYLPPLKQTSKWVIRVGLSSELNVPLQDCPGYRKGQRREPAADGVRFVAERVGWSPLALPSGWGFPSLILLFIAINDFSFSSEGNR